MVNHVGAFPIADGASEDRSDANVSSGQRALAISADTGPGTAVCRSTCNPTSAEGQMMKKTKFHDEETQTYQVETQVMEKNGTKPK